MKIGVVTTWFERGAAYVSLQYANRLIEDGAEVFIYARGGFDHLFNDNFSIEVDKNANLIVKGALNLKQLKNWIISNKLDYVLFNEQFWLEPVILAKELGVKTIAYIDYYTKNSIELFTVYDLLICNTKKHFSAFRHLGNAKYIPWGTDINTFIPISKKEENRVHFFHSAGWSPYRKGTDILIDAASELKKSFKLIIHAQTDIRELLPEKRKQIDKLLEEDKLELITKTVGAPGLYYLGDVYVYPTRLEGIGLSIAEALSCGLPVIVPDNGPMNEFIDSNSCKTVPVESYEERSDGYFWPMSIVNSSKLTEVMSHFIRNFDKINEYKRAARIHAEKNLSWHTNSCTLLKEISLIELRELDSNLKKRVRQNDIRIIKLGNIYRYSPFIYRFLVGIYKN